MCYFLSLKFGQKCVLSHFVVQVFFFEIFVFRTHLLDHLFRVWRLLFAFLVVFLEVQGGLLWIFVEIRDVLNIEKLVIRRIGLSSEL